MINHLIAAEADHSLLKKLDYYQSPALLVCDEIGFLPLGQQGSNLFFQVISARHQKKSTILTTNLVWEHPVRWLCSTLSRRPTAAFSWWTKTPSRMCPE